MNKYTAATLDRETTDKTYNHRQSNYNTKTEYITAKDFYDYEQPVSEVSNRCWLDDFGWL